MEKAHMMEMAKMDKGHMKEIANKLTDMCLNLHTDSKNTTWENEYSHERILQVRVGARLITSPGIFI